MNERDFKSLWDHLCRDTDGWNWYFLSYGEKCYAFAVVTASPCDDDAQPPPAGTFLSPHPTKDRLWVADDGTEMVVDEQIASIERQDGDTICQFIAGAFAYAQARFSIAVEDGKAP